MERPTPELNARDPGAVVGMLALIVGSLWVVGALASAVALLGLDRLRDLSIAQALALGGAVVLPACMAWFSGAAARDSARARAEARRLADATDRLLNPERSSEEAARQLATTVRGEILNLDRALEQTLERLQEVEGQIARQSQAVDAMAGNAKAGANKMISGMERERDELLRISNDLTKHAQTIGNSISRHTTAISEAARLAEAEVRAADQALDHRLTSFGAAAALINDRTQGLSSAAQASGDSAARLEAALAGALEMLAKATNLTDAARQSAEAATLAANSTAGAVRDTTHRAIDDAKRAAELIRGEAVNVEREASVALERLRDAAEAARSAAKGARAAVEDERQRARVRRPPQDEPSADDAYDTSWRGETDPLERAAPPRNRRAGAPPAAEANTPTDWTWRDLLSSVDQPGAAPGRAKPRREPAEDTVSHLRRHTTAPPAPAPPIISLIGRAGLELETVFSPSGLERIAQRARSGTEARRRAVQDAAPDAAHAVAAFLASDAQANQDAMQFLRDDGGRITELLGRGRASMSAPATQAFLLIDAAAG